jgi:hypothetical protein
MQITIGELYEASAALQVLATKELPIRSALKVRRLARAVAEHVTDANAERDKLIDKYGQKDEAGHLVHGEGNTIQLAFPAEFQAAWNELLSASVEIDDKLRLAESDLGDDGSIAANVLIGLGELLGE